MGELAAGSYNTVDGQQHNPYNFKRNPGGSSSGSAVAVAGNLAMVAVGTDTLTRSAPRQPRRESSAFDRRRG